MCLVDSLEPLYHISWLIKDGFYLIPMVILLQAKDRYPFPVGYQAVRYYNGLSYRMEVKEGARGPLFMVFFGVVICSADTPTIAWQDALKKASSGLKKAQGRLQISEINGFELFGFLDPLVQRLLRELVLEQEGAAQPDVIACSKNNGDEVIEGNSVCLITPERLSWSSTRTRQIRKSRTSIVHIDTKESSLSEENRLKHASYVKGSRKRLKLWKPLQELGRKTQIEQSVLSDHSDVQFTSTKASEEKKGFSGCTEGLTQDGSENLKCEPQASIKDEVLKGAVIPDSYDDFLSQSIGGQEVQPRLASVVHTLHKIENVRSGLYSSNDVCLPSADFLSSPKFECPQKLDGKGESNLRTALVPDSYERSQDLSLSPNAATEVLHVCNIEVEAGSSPTEPVLEKPCTNDMVPDSFDMESGSLLYNKECQLGQDAIIDSMRNLEQNHSLPCKFLNVSTGNKKMESQSSEGNTQKGDSDSLGQELTKSMITLLLPQALGILKKKGRKKRIPRILPKNMTEKLDMAYIPSEHIALDKKESSFDLYDVRNWHLPENVAHTIQTQGKDLIVSNDNESLLHGANLSTSDMSLQEEVDRPNGYSKIHPVSLLEVGQPRANESRDASMCRSRISDGVDYECEPFTEKAATQFEQRPEDLECLPMQQPVIFKSAEPPECDPNEPTMEFESIVPCSPVDDTEERGVVDPKSLQVLSAANHPLSFPDSLKVLEIMVSSTKEIQAEEEGKISLSKDNVSPKDPEANSSEIVNTSRGLEMKIISEEELSALSPAFVKDSLQSNPEDSSLASELPDYDMKINAKDTHVDSQEDLCKEQRFSDADEHIQERYIVQNTNFVPKVCLEHPMPVLVMKLNVQDNQTHVLICCAYQESTRILFVYNLVEETFTPSMISCTMLQFSCKSITLPAMFSEANGMQFTSNKQELLLLGMFKLSEKSERKETVFSKDDACLSEVNQKQSCLYEIQLVSYTSGKFFCHSRLSSSESRLYCVLPIDQRTMIAGGEKGLVTCWVLDSLTRSLEKSFALPAPSYGGCLASDIISLSSIPTSPSIIVGCDVQGLIAIWNIATRQLIRGSKLSVELPKELYVVNVNLLSDEVKLSKASRMLETEEDRIHGPEYVAASLLVGSIDLQPDQRQGSGKTVSKSWSLVILKRDGSCSIFPLDALHQRISAVHVTESFGLAGTNDGSVLLWDTVNGSILGSLHHINDEPIGCIAGDQACNVIIVGRSTTVLIYVKQ
ncbi:hypothetical protein KP509_13G073200 [Ceratopteris richardii]|uniref:Uncharacterized protein n=1 Tax=Ceratopteris richardii TaxID=49495 RepID=A0A8T2TEK4_CERRI|nr:hypothetical protein KP509_13G073200 [Ceratopteris richardii]